MTIPQHPRVAVWRDTWLPGSETFVRDQVGALERWTPVRIGLEHIETGRGLPVEPDFAPHVAGSTPWRLIEPFAGSFGLRRRAAAFLAAADADLVHAHFGTGAINALPVARRAGLPLVATFHGYDVTRTPRMPHGVGREYRRRLGHVFSYATRLVAVSDFIAGRLLELGAPADKVTVHHIGIALRSPSTVVPDDERRGITFVGRLVGKKGIDDLLDAVARLPEAVRAAHPVRVVGDGPLRDATISRARALGLDLTMLGFLSSTEVADVLASSAVFCAPSRTGPDGDCEGFGMVFLEAALQGTPVVSYAHGGVVSAVEDAVTGLLAPEGDVAALAGHLEQVLTDPVLARGLGVAGAARVRRDFDIRDRTAALERLYDEVLVARS